MASLTIGYRHLLSRQLVFRTQVMKDTCPLMHHRGCQGCCIARHHQHVQDLHTRPRYIHCSKTIGEEHRKSLCPNVLTPRSSNGFCSTALVSGYEHDEGRSHDLAPSTQLKLENTVRELMTILEKQEQEHSRLHPDTSSPGHITNIVLMLLGRKVAPRNILFYLGKSPQVLRHPLQRWEEAVATAEELGFDSSEVLRAVMGLPGIFDKQKRSFTHTFDTLRALGFYDGQIKKMLLSNPAILHMPTKELTSNYHHLLHLFPRSDLAKMVLKCPQILLNDPAESQAKMDYVSTQMGVEPKHIAKTEFLKHDLLFIETRHTFLSRAGLYDKPDKRGQTTIANPTLKNVVDVDDRYFATKVAGLTLAEYRAFVKIYAQEREEEINDELSDSDLD